MSLKSAGKARSALSMVKQDSRPLGDSTAVSLRTKPAHVFEMVRATVRKNFLFRHLDDDALVKVVEKLREVRCESGRIVCREGDRGDYFYICESGVYSVYKEGELLHTYRTDAGDKPYFGELALMYAKPRAATVRRVEPGTLWGLDRSGFREAQKTRSKADAVDVPKLLAKVQLLKDLRFDQLQQLRDRMTQQSFAAGARIMTEGEPGDRFYVIIKGSATVRKRTKVTDASTGQIEEVETDVGALAELTAFGEAALMNNAPRNASVVAKEELTCMTMDRKTFEAVLGPLQEIIDKAARARDEAARSVQQQQQAAGLSGADSSCFRLKRRLCTQSNGAVVYLAALERAGVAEKEYTMRLEGIATLASQGAQEEVLAEVALLKELPLQLGAPMVTLPPLLLTFRDERALYWVFGGRSMCTLQQMCRHARLDDSAITFALACIVAAVDALHDQRVLLHGVASPLLMIDDKGYVLVTDLRRSRRFEGEASYSLAGLPQYLAPEQVRGEGHAFAVDWWAVGVLLHELACGKLPFDLPALDEEGGADGDELKAAQAILQASPLSQPIPGCHADEAVQELIVALLILDPHKRMGSDGGGAQVKETTALLGYNWKKLADGTLNSPLAQRAANAVAERSRTAIDEPPVVEQPDWAAAGGNWAREFFDAPGFG